MWTRFFLLLLPTTRINLLLSRGMGWNGWNGWRLESPLIRRSFCLTCLASGVSNKYIFLKVFFNFYLSLAWSLVLVRFWPFSINLFRFHGEFLFLQDFFHIFYLYLFFLLFFYCHKKLDDVFQQIEIPFNSNDFRRKSFQRHKNGASLLHDCK